MGAIPQTDSITQQQQQQQQQQRCKITSLMLINMVSINKSTTNLPPTREAMSN